MGQGIIFALLAGTDMLAAWLFTVQIQERVIATTYLW